MIVLLSNGCLEVRVSLGLMLHCLVTILGYPIIHLKDNLLMRDASKKYLQLVF